MPASTPSNANRKRQHGLISVLRINTAAVFGIAILALLILLGGQEYLDYEKTLAQTRQELLEHKKAHVRERVHEVLAEIDYLREGSLLGRGRPTGEIQRDVANRIRGISYDRGQGYFFVVADDGRVLVHPNHPELEGVNILEDDDTSMDDYIREVLAAARTPEGGFARYAWSKPGRDQPTEKIAYAKRIDAWGWTVATGLYLDDIEAAQAGATAALRKRLFKKTGTILALGAGAALLLAWVFRHMSDQVALEMDALLAGVSAMDPAGDRRAFSIREFQAVADGAAAAFREIEVSRQKFSIAFQKNVALMAISTLKEGLLLEVNETFAQTAQYGQDEVIGKTYVELGIFDEARWKSIRERISATGDTGLVEMQFRTRGGTLHNVELRAQTMTLEGEACLLAVIHDVTERKQAYEMVWMLSRAIDQSPVSVVITNTEGCIEYVNPKFCEVTGYAHAELLGQNPRVLKSGETDAACYAEMWRAISEGGEWHGEFHNQRKDGTLFWEAATISGIRDAHGRVSHYLGVKEDITEKKELEGQLLQAQKLESIGQLAAGIAHEINTPIQFVGDNLRFMQDSVGDLLALADQHAAFIGIAEGAGIDPAAVEQQKHAQADADVDYLKEELPSALSQSLEGTSRVAKIVRAMKNFSHPGSAEMSDTNLNECIETALIVAKNEWKYVATVETDFAADLPEVPCMPGEFGQVVLNMVINARDAIAESGGDGTIRISTACEGGWAVVRIADTGAGIPADVKARIFDPFFTTKEVGKGSGQGLAIAYNLIVKKHHGKISVESAPGEGTTFEIRLPLARAGEALEAVS